jgi:single-strand DNA-binding protein
MINKAMIIGNLGQDPEKKVAENGTVITTFSVATTEKWKDKNSGETTEQTEWHRVVAFRRLAEICADYLRKGSKVYIEGKLQTRSWEKDGVKKYSTEIVAQEMKMLDSKTNSSGSSIGAGIDISKPPF